MGDPGNRVGGDGLRGLYRDFPVAPGNRNLAMPFLWYASDDSPGSQATLLRQCRQPRRGLSRGGMVLWEGIVASNEPMPVELRDSLPSFEELPSIPPDRSWNV